MSLAVSLFCFCLLPVYPSLLDGASVLTNRIRFSFINASLSFENKMVLFSSLQLKILFLLEFYDLA